MPHSAVGTACQCVPGSKHRTLVSSRCRQRRRERCKLVKVHVSSTPLNATPNRTWISLLRAIAECFARLSYGLGVRPSVCLSVRHTAVLCQNGAS